jgi:cysteinyl-tRNA synthetase
MYVCGMTVYDLCHIGHARAFTVFDVVARYLRWRGYQVTYVRNITDIDDKIIRRAAENNEPMDELTARFITAMHEDFDALGIERPTLEPRATEHMKEIIDMISTLIEKGHAYQATNKDVYYRVASFAAYGRLSGKRPEDLRAGARVDIEEAKDDPLDFALWKAAKPAEPSWESPWGPGRPGWHIECSAMSIAALGTNFDIHGGGMDLKFPHHENEIAQTCGATDEAFANIWMHNGFVDVDAEKMSKSLGNFFTIRDVLEHHRSEAIRYFVLSTHYRKPLSYSDRNLAQARSAIDGLYGAMRGANNAVDKPDRQVVTDFRRAMDDDFNTAACLAVLKRAASDLNKSKLAENSIRQSTLVAAMKECGQVLGILNQSPDQWFQSPDQRSHQVASLEGAEAVAKAGEVPQPALSDREIESRIGLRERARESKNWQEADQIREELKEAGVVLEDNVDGKTIWKRV